MRPCTPFFKKTNLKLKEVQLGVGSELIEVRGGGTTIPLVDRTNKIITQRDIKRSMTRRGF